MVEVVGVYLLLGAFVAFFFALPVLISPFPPSYWLLRRSSTHHPFVGVIFIGGLWNAHRLNSHCNRISLIFYKYAFPFKVVKLRTQKNTDWVPYFFLKKLINPRCSSESFSLTSTNYCLTVSFFESTCTFLVCLFFSAMRLTFSWMVSLFILCKKNIFKL